MEDLAKYFIEEEPRRRIGDVAGVEIAVTRGWWAQPLGMLLGGQVLGRLFGKPNHHMRSGLCYAAAIATAGAVHAMGHVKSARMVEAPMDTLLVTPIRTYTLYDDTGETITEDQHRGRAIGGPAANFAVGLGATLLSLLVKSRYLRFFGFFSILVGLGSLVPVAGNDGEELFRHKHG